MKEALKAAIKAMGNSNSISYEMMHVIADCKEALAQQEQEPLAKVEPCAVCGEGKARLLVLRSCDTCHSEYAGQAEMKVALGRPEQEPVFKWCSVFQEMPTEDSHILFCFGVHVVEGSYTKKGWTSLAYGEAQPDFWAYMPPPPHHKRNQELYAVQPKRPWVGLTQKEIQDIHDTYHKRMGPQEFARAIEAKLKELNT